MLYICIILEERPIDETLNLLHTIFSIYPSYAKSITIICKFKDQQRIIQSRYPHSMLTFIQPDKKLKYLLINNPTLVLCHNIQYTAIHIISLIEAFKNSSKNEFYGKMNKITAILIKDVPLFIQALNCLIDKYNRNTVFTINLWILYNIYRKVDPLSCALKN